MATSPKADFNWSKPVWELVVHVLVGSVLFAIIFVPAVGLDLLVSWLKETLSISDFIATLLTWTKYIIAGIDAGTIRDFHAPNGMALRHQALGATS